MSVTVGPRQCLTSTVQVRPNYLTSLARNLEHCEPNGAVNVLTAGGEPANPGPSNTAWSLGRPYPAWRKTRPAQIECNRNLFQGMAYPFEPDMLSSPGAGPKGWRHDGFSRVATGVRAPVPRRGGLRRVAARAPLGIGLRLPGVRARRVLAARAQGPDPAMPGLPARDLGDRGHGDAPQPPA